MADKRISQLVERINIANNDVLPIVASGAITTNKVTVSTLQDWMQDNLDVGVTSIGITLGTTGTNINVTGSPVTSSGNITINIPTASATNRGALSSADWSTFNSKVSSVGLSMPSAFSVANSPITGSGTIAVTGAGTVSQYIRGDGSLADFPQGGGGGGASVSYYLNGSVSQGTIGGIAYREINKTPILGAGTDFTIAADGYIASFITDVGDPALLEIPGGNWNFETYFQASSGGGSPTFYVELYKVNSGGTATLIASNSANPELIAFGTTTTPYFSTLAVPTTVLTITDRLALRYYVVHSGRTITLHTENSNLCQIITTFTTGLTALNGLTAQVQNFATGTSGTDFAISSATNIHTFNLPTASATNRGALSSADWSTFNGKQAALNGTGFVKISGTTISYDNSTYLTTGTAASTYLPLAGGTLTGALNGTSANFTGSVGIGTNTPEGSGLTVASGGILVSLDPGAARKVLELYATSTGAKVSSSYVGSSSYGNLELLTSGLARLTISDTGAATFSSSVTATRLGIGSALNSVLATATFDKATAVTTFTTASNYLQIGAGENAINSTRLIGFGYSITANTNQPAYIGYIETSNTGETKGSLIFGTRDVTTDTAPTTRLTIASTGAATFSSKVGVGGASATYSLTAYNSANGTTAAFGGTQYGIRIDNGGGFSGGRSTIFGVDNTFYGSYQPLSIEAQSLALNAATGGNVGIGTASPKTILQINAGSGAYPTLGTNVTNSFFVGRNDGLIGMYLGYASDGNGWIQQMRNDSAAAASLILQPVGGNVGIGTASPASALTIGSAGELRVYRSDNARYGSFYTDNLAVQITASTDPIRLTSPERIDFYTASTERMRITSGGYTKARANGGSYFGGGYHEFVNNSNVSGENCLAIGNPAGSNTNNTSSKHLIVADSAADRLYIFGNGNVVNVNNSYGSLSDIKLKENITDASPKLDDLLKVKIRNYNLIGEETKQIGVIAQELEEVFPAMIDESEDFEYVEVPQLDEEGNEVLNEEGEVVTTKERVSKGTTTKSVKYSVFVPMLIKAIQELKEEIDSLKNQMQ